MSRFISGRLAVVSALSFVLSSIFLPGLGRGSEGTNFVRGVYGKDSSPGGFSVMKETGFNSVIASPYKVHLDELQAAGMRGLVWMGSYDNSSCTWERGDDWVHTRMAEISGHPAILAYQLGDEPNAASCPSAPQQYKDRNALIKSLDPVHDTYTVVSPTNGVEKYPYEDFNGLVDILGVDVYPCRYVDGADCGFSAIDTAIRELRADGVTRFWAILQDFSTDWYKAPTAAQLTTQFDRWADSGMEGYFVYHWNVGQVETKTDHLAVLTAQNQRSFGASTEIPEPGSLPTPAPASPAPSPVPASEGGQAPEIRLKKKRAPRPKRVHLIWKGATSRRVDVFKNRKWQGSYLNDGRLRTHVKRHRRVRLVHYKVCEPGTSRCSNRIYKWVDHRPRR